MMLQGRCTPLSIIIYSNQIDCKGVTIASAKFDLYFNLPRTPPPPSSRTHHLPNHTWSSTKWHIPSAKYQLSLRKSIDPSHIDYDESCTFWRHSRVNLNTRNRRPKKKPVTLNTRSITMSHAHFDATRWITYWLRWAMHILTPCAGHGNIFFFRSAPKRWFPLWDCISISVVKCYISGSETHVLDWSRWYDFTRHLALNHD